jgi:two-component system, OmpR family, copper resistance phosphate regulon response regulator CusR
MHKFIENIIGFSLKNHVFILFMTGVLFVAGIACYQNTPIEAYPDVTNTRAKIIAQWPGRSAEEVEKFVTLPIMQQLNTIPRKTDVRSTSLFGLAVVNVLFEDGVDDFYAQQYASNRIQELSLPDGVELSIEPPSGATGEIFRYILKSDLPIREVSAVNDWVVHSLTSLENTYKSIRKSLETQFLQKNHLPLQHMAKILVIEDENRMAELLKRGLEESGHTVGTATNVSEGLRMFAYEKQDIIISDIMLPDGSGFDLCRDIRRQNETVPILILTALGTTDDKLEGFDSGADDYMVKPFDFRELNARISILLKRCQIPTVECIEYADLKVYLRTKSVSRNGQSIILTPKEYNLLLFFVQNPERILTRTEIAEKVWDTHFDTGTNFIDVYINYLRKKIDKNFNTKLIHTKPGMGFIFSYENPY